MFGFQVAAWVCFGLVLYCYVIYPSTLYLFGRFFIVPTPSVHATPPTSLIISAFNESKIIGAKLKNSFEIDYPELEVVVISDDSDDGTDAIVATHQGAKLYRQSPRGGKSLGLTRFVPEAKGEILVFSDANSMYRPDAVTNLVRHFEDPTVGYVVGLQRYTDDIDDATASESLYWRYETWIKINESRVGSVVGGDGAIFAIRAGLFEPLRSDDINDFLIPLRIVCKGYRGVFEREAVCIEDSAQSFGGEFRRKVRIVARSLRAVTRAPGALNPFRVGLFAFQLLSHKVLRWFVPLFLLVGGIATVVLAAGDIPGYSVLVWAQVGFYSLALARYIPGVGNLKLVYIANYFCLVNLAAGLGIVALLTGKNFSTWKPERVSS